MYTGLLACALALAACSDDAREEKKPDAQISADSGVLDTGATPDQAPPAPDSTPAATRKVGEDGVACGPAPALLSEELEGWIERRRGAELEPAEEALRRGSRDVLRNGKYKPTGRGKPASEYLVRAATDDSFPRINGPVDANNLISLQHCVAVSLWDQTLAGGSELELRLGAEDEQFVFNQAGQLLRLKDLVCGCVLDHAPPTAPIVTPIKDSLATKIHSSTTHVAGCIYYPLSAGSLSHLQQITEAFLGRLLQCGEATTGTTAVLLPRRTATL